jgi:hypothetical protein
MGTERTVSLSGGDGARADVFRCLEPSRDVGHSL